MSPQILLFVALELLVLSPLLLLERLRNIRPLNPLAINQRSVWIVDLGTVRCMGLAYRQHVVVIVGLKRD